MRIREECLFLNVHVLKFANVDKLDTWIFLQN